MKEGARPFDGSRAGVREARLGLRGICWPEVEGRTDWDARVYAIRVLYRQTYSMPIR